jgi:hypothetical protein
LSARSGVGVRALAFDLDGTLVDTAPDIAAALNHALAVAGLPPVAAALSRTWIGDGPDALIACALAHLREPGSPALARRVLDAAGCAAAWVGWGYGAWPADAPPGTWRVASPAELQARLA